MTLGVSSTGCPAPHPVWNAAVAQQGGLECKKEGRKISPAENMHKIAGVK